MRYAIVLLLPLLLGGADVKINPALPVMQIDSLQAGKILDMPLNSGYLDGNGRPNDRAVLHTSSSAETGTVTYDSNGAIFNGSSWLAFAGADSNTLRLPGDYTVAVWAKSTVSVTDNIIGYFVAPPIQWQMSILSGGVYSWGYSTAADNAYQLSISGGYNDGSWHLLMGMRSGTTQTFHVDNQLQDTDTVAGVMPAGGALEIGRNSNNSYIYTGNLTAFKVWQRPLTADERTHLYTMGPDGNNVQVSSLYQGRVLDIPANSGYKKSATVISDRVPGGIDMTLVDSPTIDSTGLTLNGTSQYVIATVANWRSADYSGAISAWVKTSKTAVTANAVLSTSDEASTLKYLYAALLTPEGLMRISTAPATNTCLASTTGGLNDGGWHYLVWASSGTEYFMWADGVPQSFTCTASNSGDWFADIADRDNVLIGAMKRTSVIVYWEDQIRGVVVHDRVPTLAEITHAYTQGPQ